MLHAKKAVTILLLLVAAPAVSWGQDASNGKELRKSFYPDGKLKTACEHNSAGLLDGVCKTYDKTGKLFLENTYRDNVQTGCKSFYENGKLQREYAFSSGKMNGPAKVYYENGKVQFESTYKDGRTVGISRGFYETGMLKSEVNFKDGKAHGFMKQYYESGKLKFETMYKNGDAVGGWFEYEENGDLKKAPQMADDSGTGIFSFFSSMF